ncbi:MAG: hypothetical protein AB7M12_08510 [Hyphomonadaceae bacterium]
MLDLTEEERVRAGHTGDGVRAMLAWGLGLAITAMIVTLFAFAA